MTNKKTIQLMAGINDDTEGEFIPILTDGEVPDGYELQSNVDVPLLALRNMVLFPGVVLPVQLGRQKSLNAANFAHKKKAEIAVFTQIQVEEDEPVMADLYSIGVIANVLKLIKMPDGGTTAILQGKKRIELLSMETEGAYYTGTIAAVDDVKPAVEERKEYKTLLNTIKERSAEIIKTATHIPPEAMFAIKNIENNGTLINFLCANFPFSVEAKQSMLESSALMDRGLMLLKFLNQELQKAELKKNIQAKTQSVLERQQREYFLQQQIKTIREELGDENDEDDVNRIKTLAKKKKLPEYVADTFKREVNKLSRMPQNSLDYSTQLSYLENVLDLPWYETSKDNSGLKNAQKVLDADHFGMKEVKERILEHLAIIRMRGDMKAPILCLYGPPGVGKTSLGKSIANAMNRKYVRVALGGLHDESEIRGHRRTYIGAMMGRILKGMKDAGTVNPVFILDEIDKVSHVDGMHGSPESALLEVLDPEQNSHFHDNYLDIDYDLSKVMFIATANDISTISQPLKDRMEFINITGYSADEKLEIAKRHIVPKVKKELGMGATKKDAAAAESADEKPINVKFSDAALKLMINNFTRESGVRALEKCIRTCLRKTAYKAVIGEDYPSTIGEKDVREYLGNKEMPHEIYEGNDNVGVVTGLAWTQVGGEILFIETSLHSSKTPKLTLTGQLGDVMKESATIAYEYVRANSDSLGLAAEQFEEKSLHIHVPDGSTPKDGPSAGITIATAIASAFTGRKVKANIAMTGEITLRGKVTPVGGIKEKMLAAKRAGIKEIILSKDNKKDIDEITPEYLDGLSFHYVSEVKDVFSLALV